MRQHLPTKRLMPATYLTRRGYFTRAGAGPSIFEREYPLDLGFQLYDTSVVDESAVVPDLMELLKGHYGSGRVGAKERPLSPELRQQLESLGQHE